MTLSRVEVITSVERRRRWPQAEKERLVALSLAPGTSASQIARSAGLHVSQLFRWRKQLCERIAPEAPGRATAERSGRLRPRSLPREVRAPTRGGFSRAAARLHP